VKRKFCCFFLFFTVLSVAFPTFILAEVTTPTINIDLVSAINAAKANPKGDYIRDLNNLYRSRLGKKLEDVNRDFKYYFSNATNYSSNYSNIGLNNSLSGEFSRPFIFGSSLYGGVSVSQYITRFSSSSTNFYPYLNLSLPLDYDVMSYNDFSADSNKRNIIKSELTLINSEKNLIERILETYFNILTSLISIKYEEEKYNFYQSFNKIKTVEVELGRTKEMVLLETEVQSIQSLNNLLNLRESLNDSLKNFKQLLDLPLTANVDLTRVSLESIPYDDYVIPSIENAIMSPDMIVAKMSLDEQKISLKSLRTKVTPSLSVNANTNSDTQNIANWPYSIYANVRVPLFNEADYNFSFDQQASSYQDSSNSFEKQKESRRLSLQSLVNSFNTSLRNYKLATKQLQLSRELNKIYGVQYQIGQLSLQIYVDRRNSFTDQQNNYYTTLQKLFISYSKLIIELEGVGSWYEKVLKNQLKLIK